MLKQSYDSVKEITDVRNDRREIEYYMKLYLTGRIDQKIQRIQKKINEKLPRRYYNTLNAAFVCEIDDTAGGHSDPTGVRAGKLADLYYQRKHTKDFLLQLKDTLNQVDLSLTDREILKVVYDCSGTYSSLRKLAHSLNDSHYSIKKRRDQLEDTVKKKIEPLLGDYISKL